MSTKTKSAIISTTISTPSAIETVAQPKLRKAEIIEAAARREWDKKKLAYTEYQTAKHNAEVDLKNKVADHVRKSADRLISAANISLNAWRSCTAAITETRLDNLPDSLTKELADFNKKYAICMDPPDYKKVLKEIKFLFDRSGAPVNRERVNRVNLLLTDEAACKALDEMVASLRNPPKPQLAAATA